METFQQKYLLIMQVNKHYLNAEIASVNIVTKKQIAGVCWLASNLEQFHKVIKLTMYIPTDYNKCKSWKTMKQTLHLAFDSVQEIQLPHKIMANTTAL
jgi:hypothetical protein